MVSRKRDGISWELLLCWRLMNVERLALLCQQRRLIRPLASLRPRHRLHTLPMTRFVLSVRIVPHATRVSLLRITAAPMVLTPPQPRHRGHRPIRKR